METAQQLRRQRRKLRKAETAKLHKMADLTARACKISFEAALLKVILRQQLNGETK